MIETYTPHDKVWFSYDDLAKLLHLSANTLRSKAYSRDLPEPTMRKARIPLWHLDDIREYLLAKGVDVGKENLETNETTT